MREAKSRFIAFKGEDYLKITGNGDIEGKDRASHGTLLGGSWGSGKGNYVEYLFRNELALSQPQVVIRYAHAGKSPDTYVVTMNGTDLRAARGRVHTFPATGGWGNHDKEFRYAVANARTALRSGINRLRLTSAKDQNHITIDSIYLVEKSSLREITGLITMEAVEKIVKPWAAHFNPKTGIHYNSTTFSGVPLGGIGAGKIEVLPSGWFGNITINSNWDHPIRLSRSTFFAVQTETSGKRASRILRLESGKEYAHVSNVANIHYRGMFPHIDIEYRDNALPVEVKAFMFSSLIPQNTRDSSIPGAAFRFTVRNTGRASVSVKLLFSFENMIGWGGYRDGAVCTGWDSIQGNYVEPFSDHGLEGIAYGSSQKRKGYGANAQGNYAIAVGRQSGVKVSRHAWNDFSDECPFFGQNQVDRDSALARRSAPGIDGKQNYAGVICAEVVVGPGTSKDVDFYLGWYMPNHVTTLKKENYGHYYLNHFKNASQVAGYLRKNRDRLVDQTGEWQRLILKSTLPFWLKYRIINGNFPIYSNTVYSKSGIFGTIESPITMVGALGTMDQRMASHGFTSQMFTDLDRRELDSFTKCQRPDGRITHFTGNVHQVLENPDVGYGVTDWPDLSCSWIMQIAKQFRFTGDGAYLKRQWPHIKRSLAWMETSDKDGDLVPEGGNTYDYEKAPGGMFIYNASCYLGALVTCVNLSKVLGEKAYSERLAGRFEAVKASVIDRLWNGSYFIKWNDSVLKTRNSNSFIASLAGDWLARLVGVGATMDYRYVKSNIEHVLKMHLHRQELVPPMEVDGKGNAAVASSYILQHEPYLGMEAIYAGYPDDGIEVLRRNFEVAWVTSNMGWNLPLSYNCKISRPTMLFTYMTATAAWHVFNALSGSTLDLHEKALYLHPVTLGRNSRLEVPVWYPGFWLWIVYDKKLRRVTATVVKVFKPGLSITSIRKVTKEGLVLESKLRKPFVIRRGNVLTGKL